MVDTKILNNQSIRGDLIEGGQSFDKLPALPLLYQGIEGDVELAATLPADLDEGRELGQAEVGSVGPGAEGFKTEVDCIGAVVQGGIKRFDAAGRGQEFEFGASSFGFRVFSIQLLVSDFRFPEFPVKKWFYINTCR